MKATKNIIKEIGVHRLIAAKAQAVEMYGYTTDFYRNWGKEDQAPSLPPLMFCTAACVIEWARVKTFRKGMRKIVDPTRQRAGRENKEFKSRAWIVVCQELKHIHEPHRQKIEYFFG